MVCSRNIITVAIVLVSLTAIRSLNFEKQLFVFRASETQRRITNPEKVNNKT